MIEGLLIGMIGFLQVVHHEVAVAQSTPCLAIVFLNRKDALKVLDGLLFQWW